MGPTETTDVVARAYIDGKYLCEVTELTEVVVETEQERLNRIAVEAVRSILPDNMELIEGR